MTIKSIPEYIHRARKLRVAQNETSAEAEIQGILEKSVEVRLGLGTALAKIGRQLRGEKVKIPRDRTAVKPARFGPPE